VRMAESVMQRSPDPWTLDFSRKPEWEYTYGLVLKAIFQLWLTTGDERYFHYVKAYYDHFIDSDGNIKGYNPEEYNIDRINSGKVLFQLFAETGEIKYQKAIKLLRSQMLTHPRTMEGGFWHKMIYPHQMWLDGIYMGSPFLAEYAGTFGEPEIFNDVARQLILMEQRARDEQTGLLFHGWDESRQQLWANPQTGQSPNFWGRGTGWYAMAVVDVLDFLPDDHPARYNILAILNRLVEAIVKVQDKETGLWYQVLDQGGRAGNYLESSASCMFVYSIAKGVRMGYLDSKYLSNVLTGYDGILKNFIEVDNDNLVNINQACAVAGLGGNPYRDGSYDYYVNTAIARNDPKAVGSFILASLEVEMIKNPQK